LHRSWNSNITSPSLGLFHHRAGDATAHPGYPERRGADTRKGWDPVAFTLQTCTRVIRGMDQDAANTVPT
jgi:hypothetical protein